MATEHAGDIIRTGFWVPEDSPEAQDLVFKTLVGEVALRELIVAATKGVPVVKQTPEVPVAEVSDEGVRQDVTYTYRAQRTPAGDGPAWDEPACWVTLVSGASGISTPQYAQWTLSSAVNLHAINRKGSQRLSSVQPGPRPDLHMREMRTGPNERLREWSFADQTSIGRLLAQPEETVAEQHHTTRLLRRLVASKVPAGPAVRS